MRFVTLTAGPATRWPEKLLQGMLLLLLVALCGCHPRPTPGPHPVHGYVNARIFSDVAGVAALPNSLVAVPDIEVTAKNVSTGAMSAPVKTDPYGYFRTGDLAPGKYQICVSGSNFVNSCDSQTITIDFYVHVMDHIIIIPAKQHVVTGTVKLADNTTPCFWYNPSFDPGFVMTAKVSLQDSSGTVVAGPIRGNSVGQYVIPTTAAPGSYKVMVECEAEHADATIALTTASLKQDFVLKNHPPAVNLPESYLGTTGVRRASPGDVLNIKAPASDADHDTLHYHWLDDNNPAAAFADNATLSWTAPANTGPHALRVLVSDGRGGYAISRTVMNVGPDEMIFSGTAFNRQTHGALKDVIVDINGVSANTDVNGHFLIKVPDRPRFVLNANKPGFALTSRIFYARAANIEVPMDAVQTATVDGKNGGEVSIKVTGCRPQEKNDNKNTTAASRECPRIDIGTLTLKFGPNSLVSGGSPFTGTATVEAFQYDLSLPNAIPGDQSATYKGKDARLATFGAFHITPRDAAGHPLQMAPGKTVAVSMPIHPLALASAPATIPFFSYDEASGLWKDLGELKRVGNNYTGKITHFSDFNADTAFTTSSCLKIELVNFPSTVRLNATYNNPAVGNFNHPNFETADATQPIAIERMAPNEDFTLVIDDNSSAHTILQSVALNSGPPTSVPFPVPPPYTGCNGPISIYYNSIPAAPTFLISGTASGPADYQTLTTTTAPYTNRDTLPHWLSANGFGGSATESHAVYFNNGDLKFGRDMHCRTVSHGGSGFSQDWVACYVRNYGNVGQDFSTQPTVLNGAYSNAAPVATVAMEYHPDQASKVQYWAYDSGGSYLASPTLDSQGPKPIPDICIACHQGSYGGTGTLAEGSIFLPFDIDSFIGDDGNPLQSTLGTGTPHPSQEDFRQLNAFVLQASDASTTAGAGAPSAAVQRLMDLWYKDATHTGVTAAGATFHFDQGAAQLNTNVPGSFPTNPALYDSVVKPVCRTCHVARDPTFDTWDSLSQMTGFAGSIQLLACGPATSPPHFTMPHAEVPYRRFWQNSLSSTLASELFTSLSNHDCQN